MSKAAQPLADNALRLPHVLQRNMCVDFRCRYPGMTEQFLDCPEIDVCIDEVGGEGMPKEVGGDSFRDACFLTCSLDRGTKILDGLSGPIVRIGVTENGQIPPAGFQFGPWRGDRLQGRYDSRPDGQTLCRASLLNHTDHAALKVDILPPEIARLDRPKPEGVKAEEQATEERIAGPEDRVDFLHREYLGKRPLVGQAVHEDLPGRDVSLATGPADEAAEIGQLLVDRAVDRTARLRRPDPLIQADMVGADALRVVLAEVLCDPAPAVDDIRAGRLRVVHLGPCEVFRPELADGKAG